MFKGTSASKEKGGQVQVHSFIKYPYRLNFYDQPPLDDVTLEEFETCALDRLRILSEIESSFARNRSWDELKAVTTTHCKKYLTLNSNTAIDVDVESERRKDHLGHFVLRLAFCRSEDLRRRFVKAETTLFRVRYDTDGILEREAFLNSRDFNWIPVDKAEKDLYHKELLAASPPKGDNDKSFDKFFKVKWTRVPDLVEKRKVFLKGGWAYVPAREQSSIVFQEFETNLMNALQVTARFLPRFDEDSRLVPILTNLSQGFLVGISPEWCEAPIDGSSEEIKAEMVDGLSRKHFPICMRHLHACLNRDHHLKHFGRLQYGLFLKVLGVSIDEAVAFWRKSFIGGKVTEDRFNKEHKYNIRHSFGLEGKRANYAAKSCQQIIMGQQPESSDSHGCPFRHFSPDNLQTALLSSYSSQGLSIEHLPEIMNAAQSGHYNLACTRVFEITHGGYGVKKGDGVGEGESVAHPNQYATKSRELERAKLEGINAGSANDMVLD